MEPLALDPEILERQASYVRQDASDLANVQTAASSMNLHGGAFGLMCSMLVPPAHNVTTAANNLLRDAAEMLERNSAALNQTAADFTEVDGDFAQGFNQAETGEDLAKGYRE